MAPARRIVARLLAAILLVLALPQLASAAGRIETPFKDAVSYAADLTTTGDGSTWTGTESIVVRNAGRRALDRVWLRLWGNGPVGCTPRAITVTAVTGGTKRRLMRDCTALEILLPAPLAPGAATTLGVELTISTPAIQDRFGTAEGIRLFGNALPVVAQRDVRGWQLPAYSAYGESFVSSWASFGLTLHHPVGLPVLASGTTTTTPDPGGTTATTVSAIEARDTFWAAGQMIETSGRTARGTLVRSWSTPEAGADREDALVDAIGALDEIERRLPDYPYEEYDVLVARIEAGGGMEYPGAVITDGSSEVTRHETGHQWFYGLVGTEQYREPWVDEGLTSFVEYSWTDGDQPAPRCWRADRIAVPGPSTFVTASMAYWNKNVRQYLIAYNNPVCALRDLRSLLGAGRFGKVMRGLVTTHAQGFMSGTAVRRAFRKAGGPRTDAIWRRWGLAPGR